uniref:Uncharacterized protein n=1 Tax=Catagonus wagneri TaxID=51154 RepID=A0A8C3WL05_9CETA
MGEGCKVLINPYLLSSLLSKSHYFSIYACFLLTGIARGHRDTHQASGRGLQEGVQECECKDWFLRAPRGNLMTVHELPKKPCPCDHFKGRVNKTSKLTPKTPQEANEAIQSLPAVSQTMSAGELFSTAGHSASICSQSLLP